MQHALQNAAEGGQRNGLTGAHIGNYDIHGIDGARPWEIETYYQKCVEFVRKQSYPCQMQFLIQVTVMRAFIKWLTSLFILTLILKWF